MKIIFISIVFIMVMVGCSKHQPLVLENYPKSVFTQSSFEALPLWEDEEYDKALDTFIKSCRSSKTRSLYKELCIQAPLAQDPKRFLQSHFLPYKIAKEKKGVLTGYYEPQLHCAKEQTQYYRYPIYETPKDLIEVDLSSVYPELKHYRLRGRLKGSKLIPYFDRKESKVEELNASVICYTDSKIDKFFLEIQGSGRLLLDTNETLFVGYDNQNGHRYRAIGRYLVEIGALQKEEVSLQSIRAWLEANPSRIDEVLNYNRSLVFFKQRDQKATGALGLELTPQRSVAIDRKYIPLGAMLYLSSTVEDEEIAGLVLAQDTGGAIKGAVRADLFLGYGEDAMQVAGKLNAPLDLWLLLPRQGGES